VLLDLIFETPQETTHRIGKWVYRLYERDDHYALPDVVLQTEPGARSQLELHEITIADVSVNVRDSGQLDSFLKASWRADAVPGGWMAARLGVVRGATLRASRLDRAFQSTGGGPVEARVTWQYSFAGTDLTPVSNHVTIVLEFMTPGQPVPARPPEPIVDLEADRLGVPAVLRGIEGTKDYSGFAAVDFGTSSSTVTLYDARHHFDMVIDPGQATRLRLGLAGLLNEGPLGDSSWSQRMAGLAAEVAGFDPELRELDFAALLIRLRGPSVLVDGRDLLLDATCAAVEHLLQQSSETFRDWLAPRLLQVYDAAFNVPPLEEMFLRQVVFDADTRSREISSMVTVQDGDPISIKLGPGDPTQDPAKTVRALKTKLQQPKRLEGRVAAGEHEATTDDLIALVYLALTEHAERFAHDRRDGDPEVIRSLVVTFPTTTPASTREHLRNLVKHPLQLDTVVTDFDEGVAAGLFFLLRDFGSNRREFGVEGLRARSRKVATDPPTWTQNMLVLDMGAGTTDIVLIGLTLTDMSEPIPGCPENVQGRYYVIRPEVRNSTGHPQLGGDYLTLRVFYWLKAKIVDALLYGPGFDGRRAELRKQLLLADAAPGTQPSLAETVLQADGKEPAPEEIRDKLRTVLPTDWRGRTDVKPQAFEHLWGLAEQIKVTLGAAGAKPFEVTRVNLEEILAIGAKTRDLVELLPAQGIKLESKDLQKLARPVLAQAVQLASWLVRNTLTESEALDRVMLAGRSSMMPLMRQVVVEELAAEDEDSQASLNWNPAAVTVEAEYAKQAASIGACWAQSFRDRSVGLADAIPDLIRGRTQIMIDVDNLTHTLPCAFRLQRQGADDLELLTAGIRLTEIDSEGTIGVRSIWRGLMANFQINRPLNQNTSIQWGVFHYQRRAAREGFTPSDIWTLSSDAVVAAKVRAQLEVSQTLVPYLHLCQGTPHYVFRATPTIDLAQVLGQKYWHESERRLTEIPAAVWVSGLADREHPGGVEQELFKVWLPGPEDDPTQYFPEFFRDSDDPNLPPRPGRISAPLPLPRANGEYRFFLRWPDGRVDPLTVERPPGPRGPTSRFVATLDTRGWLRIHRGNPPYWSVDTLEAVQNRPGAVFRVEMDPGVPNLKDSWDPFNGSH
jgi:hypothetical protein